jgi:NlpC/P60 family putative phage cell wall peptidase
LIVEIVEIARGWLGTKFKHQGRVKGVGVDCIGLVAGVARELGIEFEDKLNYGRDPNGNELQSELERYLTPCGIVVGAVALFRIEKQPQHVGIISDVGIIHAYAQSRKVVEHGLDAWWLERLVGCYRFSRKCV